MNVKDIYISDHVMVDDVWIGNVASLGEAWQFTALQVLLHKQKTYSVLDKCTELEEFWMIT